MEGESNCEGCSILRNFISKMWKEIAAWGWGGEWVPREWKEQKGRGGAMFSVCRRELFESETCKLVVGSKGEGRGIQ